LAETVTPGSWKKRQSNPPEIHPHTNPAQMNARETLRSHLGDINEFTLEPAGDSTKVTWAMHSINLYIMKLISVFKNMDDVAGKHFVENLWIRGDTAVEQTAFTIDVRPKIHGYPFVFKGRTQVVYVRYGDSPTGWACIRELIQTASDNR
jgi:hypothetical protein